MVYVILAFSILFEVTGTSLIKKSEGFTQLLPSAALLVCYTLSFFLMSIVVKSLPLGIVYATWSASGIILVSAAGYFFYKQSLDAPAVLGMALIIAGVIIMNVFSKVPLQ